MTRFGRLQESYALFTECFGRRGAAQLVRAEAARRLAQVLGGPEWACSEAPTLARFFRTSPVATDVEDALEWLGQDHALLEYAGEFDELAHELEAAYKTANLTCPTEWAVESGTGRLLYALVRARRPRTVVETGIANGHSSFILLSALDRNGTGHLASIDVRHDVGRLVPERLTDQWSRIILDGPRAGPASLEAELARHAPYDLFVHDGDHRFLGQSIDYAVARRGLTDHGVLISDDVETTSAWLHALDADLLPGPAMVLIDSRKAVGISTRHRRPARAG